MKRLLAALAVFTLTLGQAKAEETSVSRLMSASGEYLTDICYGPEIGDLYISTDNRLFEIINVTNHDVVVAEVGIITLPSTDWLDTDAAVSVSAKSQRIALYCTHSDESYEPSDGTYSTTERGSIYQVARKLADELEHRGIYTEVADTLHHPHDAGAYRRSRQTAVKLISTDLPDALIDIHRDGIPDPESYEVSIGGEPVSKVRLLVGRGNQNAEVNKAFALMIKSVADHVYPGLIKDIYMGKGTFNQDLLPHSILFECGTYTLEKERVLASMPLIADVLDRALYGGVTGSAGRVISDAGQQKNIANAIVEGAPDPVRKSDEGTGRGFGFLAVVFLVLVLGLAILSAGSLKGGLRKANRHISEMTGGLVGRKPDKDENPEHS